MPVKHQYLSVEGLKEGREEGDKLGTKVLLMGVFITAALSVGHMEQENLKLLISECACVYMSVSSHVSRCDSWKMCLRTTSSFLDGLPSHPSPFLADEGEEKNAGLLVASWLPSRTRSHWHRDQKELIWAFGTN